MWTLEFHIWVPQNLMYFILNCSNHIFTRSRSNFNGTSGKCKTIYKNKRNIWSNGIFRSVDRTHVYKIDDDQLMRADVLLNFGCARRNHSCSPHAQVKLKYVFHLQQSYKRYSSSQEGQTPETGGMPKMWDELHATRPCSARKTVLEIHVRKLQ